MKLDEREMILVQNEMNLESLIAKKAMELFKKEYQKLLDKFMKAMKDIMKTVLHVLEKLLGFKFVDEHENQIYDAINEVTGIHEITQIIDEFDYKDFDEDIGD